MNPTFELGLDYSVYTSLIWTLERTPACEMRRKPTTVWDNTRRALQVEFGEGNTRTGRLHTNF
jgi:hypothetical protein